MSYGYDQIGRVTTALYDDGLCVLYTYDASNNRISQNNFAAPQPPRAQWGGATTWGNFAWTGAPVWPVWGVGVWGCFQWTP